MTRKNTTILMTAAALALSGTGVVPAYAQTPAPARPPAPPPLPPAPPATPPAVAVARSAASPQAWVGVTLETLRSNDRRTVRVGQVFPGSPADQAGVQRGDTLVRINGRAAEPGGIAALRLKPGETVRLRVRRQGRERNVAVVASARPVRTVTLEDGRRVVALDFDSATVTRIVRSQVEAADSLHRRMRVLLADSLGPRLRALEGERLPELRQQLQRLDSAMARTFPAVEQLAYDLGRRSIAGAEFSELNPELADYFQGVREGVLVLRVAPETPAARAGLQAGDVVTRAAGEAVRNTTELRRIVARAGRDGEVQLRVVRKGRGVEVQLR